MGKLEEIKARKPIVVTNPNDPRLKAYSDSLYAYSSTRGSNPEIINENLLNTASIPILQKVLSGKPEVLKKNIDEIQANLKDPNSPVSPGIYGSKVNTKNTKPIPKSGYNNIMDKRLLDIMDKIKPVSNLEVTRQLPPENFIVNHYVNKNPSNNLGLKPATPNVEWDINETKLKSLFPNITPEAIQNLKNQIAKAALKVQKNPSYISPLAKYNPNKGQFPQEMYGHQYKKSGITTESIYAEYPTRTTAVPQFAAPQQPVVYAKQPAFIPAYLENKIPATPTIPFIPVQNLVPTTQPSTQSENKTTSAERTFESRASSLRYPALGVMGKLQKLLTGSAPMPYWVDKDGQKHYPSQGGQANNYD